MLSSAGRLVSSAAGAALLEVMVALALFAGAVVSLAGLLGLAARSNRSARDVTRMSIAASQKMEQLRALAWYTGEDGQEQSDLSTDVSVSPETAGGPGLRPSPGGTLASDVPGYVDYLDEHGFWLARGTGPPGRAVFTRRWSVEPLVDSPLDTLVLRVVVLRTAGAARAPTEGLGQALALTSIRTRRSR